MPGFQSFFRFLHLFVLVKLVTNSISILRTSQEMSPVAQEFYCGYTYAPIYDLARQ